VRWLVVDITGTSSAEQQAYEESQSNNEQTIADLKEAVEELTNAVEKIDVRDKDLKNDMQEQLLDMRETYALKAYRFVWIWSVFLILVIILQGSKAPDVKLFFFEFKAHDFSLDSKVVIALISGVTVNIVAVFVVVIKNLFPSDGKGISSKTKEKR
jgi:hypothetical protein